MEEHQMGRSFVVKDTKNRSHETYPDPHLRILQELGASHHCNPINILKKISLLWLCVMNRYSCPKQNKLFLTIDIVYCIPDQANLFQVGC